MLPEADAVVMVKVVPPPPIPTSITIPDVVVMPITRHSCEVDYAPTSSGSSYGTGSSSHSPHQLEGEAVSVAVISEAEAAVSEAAEAAGPTPQVGHHRTALMHPNRTGGILVAQMTGRGPSIRHMRDSVIQLLQVWQHHFLQHAGEGPNTQSVR